MFYIVYYVNSLCVSIFYCTRQDNKLLLAHEFNIINSVQYDVIKYISKHMHIKYLKYHDLFVHISTHTRFGECLPSSGRQ
jgi:hypothetical protein